MENSSKYIKAHVLNSVKSNTLYMIRYLFPSLQKN